MADSARRQSVSSTARPSRESWLSQDPFRRNLVWSATVHLVLLAGAAVGLDFNPRADLLPSSAAFIELGMSGPNPTPNLGSTTPSAPAGPPPNF